MTRPDLINPRLRAESVTRLEDRAQRDDLRAVLGVESEEFDCMVAGDARLAAVNALVALLE